MATKVQSDVLRTEFKSCPLSTTRGPEGIPFCKANGMLGRDDEAIHLDSLGQQPAAAWVLKTHHMGLPISLSIQQDTGPS